MNWIDFKRFKINLLTSSRLQAHVRLQNKLQNMLNTATRNLVRTPNSPKQPVLNLTPDSLQRDYQGSPEVPPNAPNDTLFSARSVSKFLISLCLQCVSHALVTPRVTLVRLSQSARGGTLCYSDAQVIPSVAH